MKELVVENCKLVFIDEDEFSYEVLIKEYMSCCMGSYEPTELLVSPKAQEFLTNRIKQLTTRLCNAEISISYDLPDNYILLTVDINKLNEQQIKYKLERNKTHPTSCLFILVDI